MEFENRVIKCKKFWDAEAVIKRTEVKIREAISVKEKRYYAQDILLEREALLSCQNYNAANPDCLKCHSVLQKHIQELEYLAKDEIKQY